MAAVDGGGSDGGGSGGGGGGGGGDGGSGDDGKCGSGDGVGGESVGGDGVGGDGSGDDGGGGDGGGDGGGVHGAGIAPYPATRSDGERPPVHAHSTRVGSARRAAAGRHRGVRTEIPNRQHGQLAVSYAVTLHPLRYPARLVA